MEFTNKFMAIWSVVGLCAWLIGYYHLFKQTEIFVPSKYMKKTSGSLRFLFLIIGVAAWILIGFALAGPRKPLGFAKNKTEVNDIFFVVDVSRSMLANDFKPNRLEVAKNKIADFVKLMPTDRIGIVIFSEKAFTLLPLSTDLNLISRMITEIKTGGFLGGGTNIGDALALAVGRGAQSLAKNKIIILLTDGVSQVGFLTPLQAAEEAKKQNMKVYSIGIGGRANAQIPTGKNIFGRTTYQNIPGGSYDLKTLQEISRITGGKSFVAQNETALKKVLSEIEKLEKTEIDTSGKIIYKEMYLMFLLYGASLLIAAELGKKFVLKEIV
jgi:Ca-activated chloride channel family protein